MEDGWIIARLWTLEAGVKILIWTSERHTQVDTHVVVKWDDPGEILDTTFDLVVGKKLPFRVRVTPDKSGNGFAVRFLRNVREDDVHIQGKTEVWVVDIELLVSWASETGKVVFFKLSVERRIPDLPDRCECVLQVIQMHSDIWGIK